MMNELERYLEDNRKRHLDDLREWLAIPSVSGLAEHRDDVRRAARWLVDHLERIGLQHVELIETEGHPIVCADWLEAGADRPTVLLYGHYDVQPVDPLDEWVTPPFEPTVRSSPAGDAIFARGATDDKGQALAQIHALEALLATAGELPVNVKLLVEGEEEVGSRAVTAFAQSHAERLAADACVISDTSMIAPGRPSIDYGLRGAWACELIVRGPATDLHSGGFGGAVHNPAQALAEIVATMHDAEGRVSIEGFYDGVRELGADERARLAEARFGDEEARQVTGVPALYGEPGFSVVERIGARPTLELNGIAGGYYGEGFKTVIPREARAKISCRLVPHQDPGRVEEAFRAHLERVTPPTVTCEIVPMFGLGATLLDPDSAPMRAAARALETAFGRASVFTLGGGGIPIVSVMCEVLDLPVVLMGLGLPDDNAHAPNEKLLLENFHRGTRAGAEFLRELGQE
jgi:acetylornithine deacetylase/succinyl-diaminopimelate desuccinylase-like protein